jgi:signal transduction histidine kinase
LDTVLHSLYPKSNEDLIVREPMYQENIREQVIREELSHVLESSMFAQSDRQRTVREERTRIARELHDTLLQTFLSASMQLGVAVDSLPSDSPVKPRLDRILQLMDQGIKEGRNTIQGLRSPDSRAVDLVLAFPRFSKNLVFSLKSIFASLSSAESSRCALLGHKHMSSTLLYIAPADPAHIRGLLAELKPFNLTSMKPATAVKQ